MNVSKLFSIELEQEILGSLIKDNDKVCEVIDIIKPLDFYKNNHQIICKVIFDLYQASKPIDITTIIEKLGKSLSSVGGLTYISEIIGNSLNSKNIKAHAEILKEKSNTRELLKTLKETTMQLENEDVKSFEVIEELNNKTLNIKDASQTDNGSIKENLNNLMDTLEQRKRNGGAIQGIATGFSLIDKTINGLNKQELIIIAARPSMGKTAVANNLATNTALRKKAKVNFFSLEMGKEQILERILSSLSNIEFENIKTGKIDDKLWPEIMKVNNILYNSSLRIYDKVFTLKGIKAECKKRKLQGGLDVVIIDYLQLIEGNKSENRQQEVSDISRQLKLMAKELECTVIALSQLSRACEQRADHRPMLADLRESGAIEQDADIIMFLYRDEYYNPKTEDKGIIENIIAKNRNGELGTIKLLWMPKFQKVGERTGMTYEGKY